jgi:hypothetical protein
MSAWTRIAHTELGSQQASIALTSIPGTYTDLLLKTSLRVNRSTSDYQVFYLRINDDTTAANYLSRRLYRDGSFGVYSESSSGDNQSLRPGASVYNLATSNTFSNGEFYIPNYTSSVAKSLSGDSVTENNSAEATLMIHAGRWAGTSAITKIELFDLNGSNFMQYSSVTLYGITKGSSGGVTVS